MLTRLEHILQIIERPCPLSVILKLKFATIFKYYVIPSTLQLVQKHTQAFTQAIFLSQNLSKRQSPFQ